MKSSKMKLLVDGQEVEVVNERMLKNQQEAQLIVDAWNATMLAAPTWWPQQVLSLAADLNDLPCVRRFDSVAQLQGDDAHKTRMRDAEKVLLEEHARFSGHRER